MCEVMYDTKSLCYTGTFSKSVMKSVNFLWQLAEYYLCMMPLIH